MEIQARLKMLKARWIVIAGPVTIAILGGLDCGPAVDAV